MKNYHGNDSRLFTATHNLVLFDMLACTSVVKCFLRIKFE